MTSFHWCHDSHLNQQHKPLAGVFVYILCLRSRRAGPPSALEWGTAMKWCQSTESPVKNSISQKPFIWSTPPQTACSSSWRGSLVQQRFIYQQTYALCLFITRHMFAHLILWCLDWVLCDSNGTFLWAMRYMAYSWGFMLCIRITTLAFRWRVMAFPLHHTSAFNQRLVQSCMKAYTADWESGNAGTHPIK